MVAIVAAGLFAAGVFSARLELQKGAASLHRGSTVTPVKAGTGARTMQPGDRLVLQKASSARISLSGKNSLQVDEKSSVVLNALKVSPEKRKVDLDVTVQRGTIKPFIYKRTAEEVKEKRGWAYDFLTRVGRSVVRGDSFVGLVERPADKLYTVDVLQGTPTVMYPTIQEQNILIKMGSALTVDEGPPLTLGADPDNKEPLLCSYLGAVIFLLEPGQEVSLEWDEEGRVILTNMSDELPLRACSWVGAPSVTIQPGESRVFDVVEPKVNRRMGLRHMEAVGSRVFGVAVGPERLVPVGIEPGDMRGRRRWIPVSPSGGVGDGSPGDFESIPLPPMR